MIEGVTLLNQGWTVFLLVMIGGLLYEWFPATAEALRRVWAREELVRVDWILIAIVISHVGLFLDNLYWLAAWSGVYLEAKFGQVLLENGVFANTIFRQGLGILAVYLHLFSAWYDGEGETQKIRIARTRRALWPILRISAIVAVMFTIALWSFSQAF